MRSYTYFKANVFFLFSLVSCGYQWAGERPTISIPYVIGDADGSLTQEIARAIALSGVGVVEQWGAKYCLQVSIAKADRETIGYRRDRQQIDGKSRKQLLAAERRKILKVEASLYEGKELVKGPFHIEAYSDYDYVDGDSIQDLEFIGPNGALQVVLPFSLGQLEPSESAEEAAMRPLNVHLARKIVEQLWLNLNDKS